MLVDQLADTETLRQQRRHRQPAMGQQIVLVKADRHAREIVRCFHPTDALPLRDHADLDTRIVPGRRAFAVQPTPRTHATVVDPGLENSSLSDNLREPGYGSEG
jgi:hypothetical protein